RSDCARPRWRRLRRACGGNSMYSARRSDVRLWGKPGNICPCCASPLPNPKPTTEEEANSNFPPFNVKTARLWRAILPSTHLAREGRMTVTIGRRELLVALGGVAAAWPLAARAQRPDRMRRIGVLMHLAADDAEGQRRIGVFLQGLQEA